MVTRETSLTEGLARLGVMPRREDAVALLDALTGMLLDDALPAGFLGPSEGPRIVGRHVLEGCALLPWIDPEARVIDVGSGAGLPGLPIACVHDGPVVLLESQGRRCAFLRRTIQALGLELPEPVGQVDGPDESGVQGVSPGRLRGERGAEVLQERAEVAGRGALREWADVAVARALAQAPVALELSLPFVQVGGRAVIPLGDVPARGDADDEEDGGGWRSDVVEGVAEVLGGRVSWEGMPAVPGGRANGSVMIVEKVGSTPARFPRRPGVPGKRPLS